MKQVNDTSRNVVVSLIGPVFFFLISYIRLVRMCSVQEKYLYICLVNHLQSAPAQNLDWSSLRTADVFPVAASLPPAGAEKTGCSCRLGPE